MIGELVLRHRDAWRAIGDWETRLLGKRLARVQIDRPVFIAGLARAGTTILLRKLCELPGFASHRYADFPFLFTPYVWAKLRRVAPARQLPQERMHRDRIMVTAESPEAMEEVLWMAFFPDLHDPARSNVLDAAVGCPAFESFFADHVRKLLLARGAQRYVSKNNYNLTRLPYLARIFGDARFLLPVRRPDAHVASLMKQHALFSRVQAGNPAARRHLLLAGHFEFGLDRRPMNPGDTEAIAAVQACWDRGEAARGWARYWALAYGHVLDRLEADAELAGRALIVRYEDLCGRSADTMTAVLRHVGAPSAPAAFAEGLSAPDYYHPQFTEEEMVAIAQETSAVARRFGYS